MQRVTLRGSLPASLCPFRPDLTVDDEALAAHVRWLADASGGGGVKVALEHLGRQPLGSEERARIVADTGFNAT